MKGSKKTRLLILVFILLAVLALILFLLDRGGAEGPVQPDSTVSADAASEPDELYLAVEDFDFEALESIRVSREDESFTIVPVGTESYQVAEYPWAVLEDDVVWMMRFVLSMLSSMETISGGAALADFGLENPEAVFTAAAGGEELTLLLGRRNPDGSARYLMRAGDPDIYLVNAFFAEPLFPRLYDIRRKTIAPINIPELVRLSVSDADGERFVIERTASDDPFDPGLFPLSFSVPFDPPRGVNDSKLMELLGGLQNGLLVREYIDEPGPLSEYGLDAARAVELSAAAGDGSGYTLLLGSTTEEGLRYALASRTSRPVLLIAAADLAVADLDPFPYTQSFIALVGIDKIDRFELDVRGVSVVGELERSADGDEDKTRYLIDGREIDEKRFKEFYQVVIGRQVDGLADETVASLSYGTVPVVDLVYIHKEAAASGVRREKRVRLFPYDDEFLILEIDGGERHFLVGRYQADYLEKQVLALREP